MHDKQPPRPERRTRRWTPRLLLGLALSAAPLAAGAGELLVLDSTTLDLRPGDVAQEGEPLEVPNDTSLTLLAPSGGILRIEGPWQGRIEAPEESGGGLIGQVLALLQSPAPRTQLGATRGGGNCVPVDLTRDRDVCITRSTCLTLQAPDAGERALVVEGPGMSAAEAPVARDHFGWSWPRGLDLEPGTYRLSGSDLESSVELRLHAQPDLPSRAHAAAWMSEVGCTAQAHEILARLGR